jgi:uroporphyrinogen decarboxylase
VNSLQRIAATIQFDGADRVPVIAQVFGHAARLAGVPLDDYVRDGETLARCQLNALQQYGYDAVFSVMDTNVETEAAGSVLRYPGNQYSVIERYALSNGADWTGLAVPDPLRDGRMPELLKALTILRHELRDDVAVIGCILGPFTLATQLLGLEQTLYLAIDDPPTLSLLMDFATETVIRFGLAQLQAGAHLPMVFDPSASPAVIPPSFFREFELPRLQRVFHLLSKAGATANWLHIAGPVAPILPYYAKAGVDIANFDYVVSAGAAKRCLPGTCFNGNIKSLLFVEGSPAEVETEACDLLHAFRDRRGFILSSGCEIPPDAKPEHVAALVKALGSKEQ